MKKSTYILILSLICYSASAHVNLDSLWGVWNDPNQNDTIRIKAMSDICWEGYMYSQPDSAFYFAGLQYKLATEIGNKQGIADALTSQGVSFYVRGNYSKAIDFHSRSLMINEEIGDKKSMSASLNNIGLVYHDQGDYAHAIAFYMRSLKITEETGHKKGTASILSNIGNIYRIQGEYSNAIDFYRRALKIDEENKDKYGMGVSLNNIGLIYREQGDHVKAIDYLTKAIALYSEIGDSIGVAYSLNNIGTIYGDQGEYNKAIDYCNRSLLISKDIGDKIGIASSLSSIGINYHGQGDNIKAIDYCSKALLVAEEIGALNLIKVAASALWKANKKLGKHKQALEMYELYVVSRDSLESEENEKEVIRQEYKYEYEKQAAADSIKSAEAQKVTDAQLAAQDAQLEQEATQRYALLAGVGLLLLFGGFMYNRFRITSQQRDVIAEQKEVVEKQKAVVIEAHEELSEKNKEITDSIQYAKRIQSAILPPSKLVKQYLNNSFILYKPKDVVAGDFYWMEPRGDTVFFAVADCTGHGVPGAMVSVICVNGLNRSVREFGLTEPGEILDNTRKLVIKEFEKSEEEVKDGMDIALCSLEANTLKYAGANNPLWILRNGEILETKGDKQPIGKYALESPFVTHSMKLQQGDSLYLFSDGYVDQFGGERGKKFKAKALRELLLSIQDKPMEEQNNIIYDTFETWRGDNEQIDDVCMIGVRV